MGPLEIGPMTVIVDETPEGLMRAKADAGDASILGHFVPATATIVVDPDQTDASARVTVLHEVFHAIWWNSGMRGEFTSREEELVVTAISSGLLDVLRRNPELVAYLTSGA